ncbi:MAG: glycosyl transferase [Ignavibacteriae bacterium]|nr:glycosyl transferase [Ignavibacteriota bacterium]
MYSGILVGYFGGQDGAGKAFRHLRGKGFRVAAHASKGADGSLIVGDSPGWRLYAGALTVFVLFGATALAALLAGAWPLQHSWNTLLIPSVLCGVIGASLYLMWQRRTGARIGPSIIREHARWLVSGESVLILQVPFANMHVPVTLLTEFGEIPPALFIEYPDRVGETKEAGRTVRSLRSLSGTQLQEHARRLSVTHRLAPGARHDPALLKRIEQDRLRLHEACLDLDVANTLEQSVSPVAEWLLDNEYVIEGTARNIVLNMPRRFYRQLPVLTGEPGEEQPRVSALAKELVQHSDLRVDRDSILAFLTAYQRDLPLTIGELWAVPQMLRIALIEGIQQIAARTRTELRERSVANLWANRLIVVSRRDPQRIFSILAEMTSTHPDPSPYFASQLVDYLYDEESALAPVQSWLERTCQRSLNDLSAVAKARQTSDQVSVGNAFSSLRRLDLLDWNVCFEELSRVEWLLRQDPAGVYACTDFTTRDRCRRAVEDLRRGSGLAEDHIAGRALDLATTLFHSAGNDVHAGHVATFLIGDRRGELAALIGGRESPGFRMLQWTYRHHALLYSLALGIFTLLSILVPLQLGLSGAHPAVRLLITVLLIVPGSQLALEVVNFLVMRLLPPRILPKMDYRVSGIPDACRTLVVVPVILTTPDAVSEEAEKLEIRYLANKEDNLLFGLFTDLPDAPNAHQEGDDVLVRKAKAMIRELNARYGGKRFLLFHRDRTWNDSEQQYIGWERKRGKLEELNGLINGTRQRGAPRLLHVGDHGQLVNIRYIITLDSDTQLPNGTARRMIETLSHPLNQVRFDKSGHVIDGYTIIQPRVSASLPSMSGSPFSRLFSNPVGIDPYTSAVSDVHQDLAGEGSYHGKGIYDVRAFHRILANRFPESRILSHDLIEGVHVRVGLASDIELFDEFPQDYQSYIKRHHRWVRGDWQIAEWILPFVPGRGGQRIPNALSHFARGKIFDNLRRSLLPVASTVLLVASWSISLQAGVIASCVVGAQLLLHSMSQPLAWATTSPGATRLSLRKFAHDLLRVGVEAALLPYQGWQALDAIVRALHRRFVSHRKLLEWTPARAMEGHARSRLPAFLRSMGLASLCSLLGAVFVYVSSSPAMGIALPWLVLWVLSPGIGWLLNRRPTVRLPETLLKEADKLFLRNVACRTWRYFAEFVNERTSWLPPDNYQVAYQDQLAMRTSPTNIGLWMVSALGAHQFGYISIDDVIRRLSATMKTIAGLERHEGHLLNWYDIQTLVPLKPRYVSTVDSGNLLGALVALDQGLGSMIRTELLDDRACAGLYDAGEALRQAIVADRSPAVDVEAVRSMLGTWGAPPDRIVDLIATLRGMQRVVEDLYVADSACGQEAGHVPLRTRPLHELLGSWIAIIDRYLGWIEIMGERPAEVVARGDPEAISALTHALSRAPSLHDLARGELAWIESLQRIRAHASAEDTALLEWIDRVFASFDTAKWFAGEMVASGERLREDVRGLSASMNMRFLYDNGRRLFSIGYNVTEGRLDHAYYDLLASEARLGSFIAIARGDVPAEHWFAMGRPYGALERRQVLLSWTGTMFEYLMPLLFQRTYPRSLLDRATREAVVAQMSYGKAHHAPWGMSESASGDLDINKTYQYNAFGVPSLGLKRGLTEEVVVAPYATLLALSIVPREGVANLRRLTTLGMLGPYGFFEAMDFSKQTEREGQRGVIVQAYMAHHQGMGFLALVNLLQGDLLQGYFHDDMRVRTVEPLLQERTPHIPPSNQISMRARVSSVAALGEVAPSVSQFATAHTATPRTQLLSNGRLALMITNAGGGYIRWNDIDITRWMSDRTRDPWGVFCYIHDVDAGRLWCTTYQPVGGKPDGFSADFSLDRAVFHRVDHGIESETEIIVVPDDDVEIRRITLINRSLRSRQLDLTSYYELALAPHKSDRQHPAFNKLFIQTEAVPGERAILASRRLRQENETPIHIGHRFTGGKPDSGEIRYETDRTRFIGRGRTLAAPMGAVQEPGNSQGVALDPILSLRESVIVDPGERVQLSMIVACGPSREYVLRMMNKYGDETVIARAMDLAWGAAQLELRLMRIQPDDARRFQQLGSHMLFPNLLLRSPAERIAENRKGQAGLWAYGISGDLPIALVAIDEKQDLGLVRQMLQAHAYWRMHGLTTDLVILNEESPGYERPLHEQLERSVHADAGIAGIDRPGGVFLRSAESIPADDQTLLRAVAAVVMVAARGNLSQQLGVPPESPDLPAPLVARREYRDPSAALPFMELPYFNSIGGFTPDGREYAIYLGPGMHTPMPWVNVMANPGFGTLVSETGSGFTWQGNSQSNRLTQWSNDPVTDPASEAIYVRDEETGAYWTPCARPIREPGAYRARHGAGYSVFEHNSHGIEQELTVFVPVDDDGGEPVKLQRLVLRNDSARTRRLSVTYYVEWTLGDFRESSQMHVVTGWDGEANAILAYNHYHPDSADQVAFAAISLGADSYSADRTHFLGRNRSVENPAAMERVGLSRRTGAGLDPCAAVQAMIRLLPGEQIELTCMVGQVPTVLKARELVHRYRDNRSVEAALAVTRAWWDERLGAISTRTPEPAMDLLVNRWLLYQTLVCRLWGRSGFYQSGGAYGFRDQLQDVMALLYTSPGETRKHILRAASRQFAEGDVQHWWHPQNGAGIRSRISDDLLWLPAVVAHYVRITGDVSILHESVPFLQAPALERSQHESLQVPAVSPLRTSLFDHCQRAIARGQTAGEHGLPLIGTGDWNDGMNRVGAGGKGESVWLAWFLADVLKGMAELSGHLGLEEARGKYSSDRAALIAAVEAFAWDGQWYIRATSDDGTPIGASACVEARIDSLPQSWAWISGAADGDRAKTALSSAWEHLVREDEGLILLFDPPFNQTVPSPGYIQGYPPGVRENGGQYTHAALWLVLAMARSGDGTRAGRMMRMLNPVEHTRDPGSVWRYGTEPYVIAADVYRLPGRTGQGGWSWYTGSAGLMYRVWVEDILGLRVRGETMEIVPVIPEWWDGFTLTYRHGDAIYEIHVENPYHCERGVTRVVMDGRPMRDGIIPLVRDLVKHRIVVRMEKSNVPDASSSTSVDGGYAAGTVS